MLPVILFSQGKTKRGYVKPDTTIYTSVEQLPEFPGGLEKMGTYLAKTQIPTLDKSENPPAGSLSK
jgi:hypothetical protein